MRREFHPILFDYMRKDERIHITTADLGFKMLDAIRDEFPDRFHNVAASEQCMMGTAIGLAEDGLLSLTYTISPFYWRAAGWIRDYINHEKVPVKMIGAGRGEVIDDNGTIKECYAEDGFSHSAGDIPALFSCFPNVVTYYPQSIDVLNAATKMWLYNGRPSFLSLRR